MEEVGDGRKPTDGEMGWTHGAGNRIQCWGGSVAAAAGLSHPGSPQELFPAQSSALPIPNTSRLPPQPRRPAVIFPLPLNSQKQPSRYSVCSPPSEIPTLQIPTSLFSLTHQTPNRKFLRFVWAWPGVPVRFYPSWNIRKSLSSLKDKGFTTWKKQAFVLSIPKQRKKCVSSWIFWVGRDLSRSSRATSLL